MLKGFVNRAVRNGNLVDLEVRLYDGPALSMKLPEDTARFFSVGTAVEFTMTRLKRPKIQAQIDPVGFDVDAFKASIRNEVRAELKEEVAQEVRRELAERMGITAQVTSNTH